MNRLVKIVAVAVAVAGLTASTAIATHVAANAPQPRLRVSPALKTIPVHLTREDMATGNAFVAPSVAGTAVLYNHLGNLWLYNMTSRRATQLTDRETILQPRMPDASTVSWTSGGKVIALDLVTAKRRTVASVRDDLYAYAWSPDRNTMAILSHADLGKDKGQQRVLRIVDLATGTAHRISLPGVIPNDLCGPDDHEAHVTFSTDGSMILVEDTTLQEGGKTVYVAGLDGRMIVKPIYGVYARWIPGTTRFVARGYDSGRWFTVDAATDLSQRIGLPAGALYPAVSPDGETIAYAAGRGATLALYSVATGSVSSIGRGFSAPMWLSNATLAATEIDPDACDCGDVPYLLGNRVALFDRSGRLAELPFDSTQLADVSFRR